VSTDDISSAEHFEAILSGLSARFIALPSEQAAGAITPALGEVCGCFGTDRATLIEFEGDCGSAVLSHSWARPPYPPMPATFPVTGFRWYFGRLARGEDVVLRRLPEDLPCDALAEVDHVVETGFKANITVPVRVGTNTVCALATGMFRSHRDWTPREIERLRTLGHILAHSLYRARAEAAMRASIAEITALKEQLAAENVYLREEIRNRDDFGEIVGTSPALERVLAMVAQVATSESSVLLLGETGTGKELLARAIHDRSPRRGRPFVKLNCAALPHALIESELFGHEKGAFTGAVATKPGRFELADGGTIFLDEIGELPPDVQVKLLRVLQEGEVDRLGSTRTRRVDVRVIAATNRDLQRAMAAGQFREDLYYRLSVFPIRVPPLRERRADIPLLAWSIINRRQGPLGRQVTRVPRRVMDALVAYRWPGNVRELENVIERALILTPGPELRLADSLDDPARTAPSDRLADTDRLHILRVLDRCGGRINGPGNAADVLGLHPNTLRSRLKKLGIARSGATFATR
jgi:formate hydrogenlyase transcriptional activator